MTATVTRSCLGCHRPMSSDRPQPAPGTVRYGAYGRCQACDRAMCRGGKRQPGERPMRAVEGDVWPRRP